jgi:hypothetical protein
VQAVGMLCCMRPAAAPLRSVQQRIASRGKDGVVLRYVPEDEEATATTPTGQS